MSDYDIHYYHMTVNEEPVTGRQTIQPVTEWFCPQEEL